MKSSVSADSQVKMGQKNLFKSVSQDPTNTTTTLTNQVKDNIQLEIT